jgi:mRNA deadenylase 3'-5' endonuclease subunit Ccr4
MRLAWVLVLGLGLVGGFSATVQAESYQTYWKPPLRMTSYDLRIASGECRVKQKDAMAAYADKYPNTKRTADGVTPTVVGQAAFEKCMKGLGATLVQRDKN